MVGASPRCVGLSCWARRRFVPNPVCVRVSVMRTRFLSFLAALTAFLVVLFVYVYPPKAVLDSLESGAEAQLPYLPAWNYRQSINACGPYSAAAVIRLAKGQNVSSEAIAEATSWRIRGYTLPFGVASVLRDAGLEVSQYRVRLTDAEKVAWLKARLSQGSPVILLVRKDGLLHYVTLVGYNETSFEVYDSLLPRAENGLTTDENGEAPGNSTWSNEDSLIRWNAGELFGLYQNYAIVSREE